MPGFDGWHLLARLRALDTTARIRCIVYSEHDDMKRSVSEAGVYDFIKKGDVAELRDSLERFMGLERD